jgi:hypothetical protein
LVLAYLFFPTPQTTYTIIKVAVAVGFTIPPPGLHPVVTVDVYVGITQPVVQVGHTFFVTVWVGVMGQQSVLDGK